MFQQTKTTQSADTKLQKNTDALANAKPCTSPDASANIEMRFLDAAEAFLAGKSALLPFFPFPRAAQRSEYGKLPSDLRQKIISMGETYLNYPYPPIYATDFMAFRRTGNRVAYEDIYFARRYALNSLVAAECIEYRGRFWDDIINGIFAICEESAWHLPSHNSYVRNEKQDILPDSTRPILDLFACETGAQLACVSYLLQQELNIASPCILTRIKDELQRRIITPYLTEHFWWMGQGMEPMCNWTPWCTQNVLLTFFLFARTLKSMSDDGQSDTDQTWSDTNARQIIRQAAASCDYFLKDYGEDGCCDEGAQYFRHAGLCLDGAANILNHVTGGAFLELMEWPKVKNMASYIFHVHVDGKYYFNFSDCSPIAGRAGVREYLFGKHTDQPELMQFAAEDFKASKDMLFEDESHQLNLFYRMQTIFCYGEIMAYDTAAPLVYKDIYYPSVGLFLTRNETFSLAVKAGDNDDNHNHNDTGSLTLYKNGQPILVDIGVESYTQKTFSNDRYSLWTLQSGYHNLPTIEGMDQHAGAQYCARQVVTAMDQNGKSSISMELSGAYPLADSTLPYTRSVVLDKNANCVTLTDCTRRRDVILNFITYEKPDVTENTIRIGGASMTFSGASLAAVEVLPITDPRLRLAWEHNLYRIRLQMEDTNFRMDIF